MEANFTLAGLQKIEHPGLSSAVDIFMSLLLSQDFVPKSTTSQLSPLQVSSLPYLWVVLGSPCLLCTLSSLFMCSYLLSAYLPLWRWLILCLFRYDFKILSGFVFSLPTPIAPLLCEEVSSADFLPFTSVPYWCCWPLGLVPSRVWQMGNCIWTGQECKLSPSRHLQTHFSVNCVHNSDLSICFVAEGMAAMAGMTWSRGHVWAFFTF